MWLGIKSFGKFSIITATGVGYRFFILDVTEEDVIDFVKSFEPDEL